jgi:hypothetical protein
MKVFRLDQIQRPGKAAANWSRPLSALLCLCLMMSGVLAQTAKLWSKKKPIRLDFDMANIAEPRQVETGQLYDFADGTFFQQVKQGFDFPRQARALTGRPKESLNTNTYDEVPDSSWFTNRMGRRAMSPGELRRGPDTTSGPSGDVLTVTSGKSVGITPGFRIRDAKGVTWFIKFDPPQYPELATGAEVIATKLFYAIGYNVPENQLFRFRREQLQVDAKAKFTDNEGNRRTMTVADLDELLTRVARDKDGSWRCLASRALPGKPKGGFSFHGVRADDPNDIIPHEHRRDVRALRVFCAWLEHNDIRVGNTLDMYVQEGDRQFLRHYLIDFGSTLGSDTLFPNLTGVGFEHQLDFGEAAKTFFTLGLYQRPWYRKGYAPLVSPAVGVYSAQHFNPRKWKQNFPLVAFENMTERDARWAAEIVASFTDEHIRAVVELGEYSNPSDTEYLTRELIARRDKIMKAYLPNGSGFGRARLESAGHQQTLALTDYRHGEGRGFEYELKSVGSASKLIARGHLQEPRLVFDSELIERLRTGGATEEERGVAELTLKRAGEKAEARIFLFAEPNSSLRIVGMRL